jgi:hypothetical protein
MTYTFKLARRLALAYLVGLLLVVLTGCSHPPIPETTSQTAPWLTLLGEGLTYVTAMGVWSKLGLLVAVWLGAVGGQFFAFQGDFEGAKRYLKTLFPGRTPTFHAWANFWVCTILGALLGMILFEPQTLPKAVMIGIGWPILVRLAMGAAVGALKAALGTSASVGRQPEEVPGTPQDSSEKSRMFVERQKFSMDESTSGDRRSGRDRRKSNNQKTPAGV